MSRVPDPTKMKPIPGPYVENLNLAKVKITVDLILESHVLDTIREISNEKNSNLNEVISDLLRNSVM